MSFTELDSLAVANAQYTSCVTIDSTHFIMAYQGTSNDGFISTFSIDGSYVISLIDTLEHDTSNCTHNKLVKIDSTHFALVYGGSGETNLKTFSIDGSYVITEEDSYQIHTASLNTPKGVFVIDSTHLIAFVEKSVSFDSRIEISTYSLDGSFDITQIDTFDIGTSSDSIDQNTGAFAQIDSTHFALSYRADSEAWVEIVSVDGSYIISSEDAHELSTSLGVNYRDGMICLDSSHLLLLKRKSGSPLDLYATVLSFDGSYTLSEVSEKTITTEGQSSENAIALHKIDDNNCILFADRASGDEVFKLHIDTNYDVSITENGLRLSTGGNSVCGIDSTHFFVGYESSITSYVSTISLSEVENNPTSRWIH